MARKDSRGRKPEWQKSLVKERIARLFEQAEEVFYSHPDRSRRYVEMARKLAMRYNQRLSREQKSSFCQECSTLLKPGHTSTARTSPKQRSLITTCKECGHKKRRPYRKESGK